jgi:hypothetical protein
MKLSKEQQVLKAKMHATAASLSTRAIVECYKQFEKLEGDHVPVLRGVLMDVLEERDPIAFNQWLETDDAALIGNLEHFFCPVV